MGDNAAQCEYQDFADELMRDQFIPGLTSDALRVKLIGKGHRHKTTQAKVKLREVVEVAKTFEATTFANQLMKTARNTQQDLRLPAKKIQFKSPSVTFMGHKLTDKGVEPDPAKVDAITKMPTLTDKVGVQRFLAMCQYLSKFCHNLSETVLPLRDLTKENSTFLWSNNHENAFNTAKNLIASATALRCYDPTLPVTLQVDASEDAIGRVLLQND